MFQRARAASVKALRWEQVGPVRGRTRRPGWLQLRESARCSGGRGNREDCAGARCLPVCNDLFPRGFVNSHRILSGSRYH